MGYIFCRFISLNRSIVVPTLVSFLTVSLLTLGWPLSARAAAPLAVLKSARDAAAYQDAHIGTFEDDYALFKQTLEAANVRFDEIGDSDASQLAKLNAYQVVVVPLLVDLPPDVASALTEFQRSGGKLLITDSGGTPQAGAQALEQAIGVAVAGHSTATEKLSLSCPGHHCR